MPSGIVRPNKVSIIGNGVVIDPWALLDEIKQISKQGIRVDAVLHLSEAATLIMPFHKEMDEIRKMQLVQRKLEQLVEELDRLMKIKPEDDL